MVHSAYNRLQKIYGSSIAIFLLPVNHPMAWSHFRAFFQDQKEKLWLGIAFFLVAVLAFEAGWLKRSLNETEPLVLTIPNNIAAPAIPERQSSPETRSRTLVEAQPGNETVSTCAFVGSKNSNKYHTPTSRCAKQIKTENRICFDSVATAQVRGYVPGCLE